MPEVPPERPLVCLLRDPAVPDPFVQALEAAGWRAACLPVLRFDFVNRAALRAALRQPDAYGGLVLTSPRAAEALARAGRLPASWTTRPAFAVGPRTADAARALGLRTEGEEAGAADALAERITRQAFEAPLLFLCGDRRRDDLPQRLRAAGTPFYELCVYRTHLRRDLDFGALGALAWVVFFSPSGVEAARQAAGPALEAARKAAIGPTTAEALQAAGWTAAAVAAAPTPEALAAALRP